MFLSLSVVILNLEKIFDLDDRELCAAGKFLHE